MFLSSLFIRPFMCCVPCRGVAADDLQKLTELCFFVLSLKYYYGYTKSRAAIFLLKHILHKKGKTVEECLQFKIQYFF